MKQPTTNRRDFLRGFLWVLLGVLLVLPAGAEMCTLDDVPAATLLLPYFELPLDDPSRNVIVTLHNATPEPTLMHVTLWTDWGFPTIDWDIFLTGYDVQTLNLQDLFTNGNLPITADAQSDPDDTISPAGDPAWDGDLQDCQFFFPFYINPLINGSNYDRVVDGHTGQPVAPLGGNCAASPSPNLARGYITFDVSRRCSTEFPHEPFYFDGFDPVGIHENRIFGEVTTLDLDGPDLVSLTTQPLVHIEADETFDASSTASGATFYGRYHSGGVDRREPLGLHWGVPVHDAERTSRLVVWRDPQEPAAPFQGWECGVGPSALPIDLVGITCWNDQEDVVELCQLDRCLGLETQAVSVDDLLVPWTSGWCRLDLRSSTASPTQAWVGVLHEPATGTGPVSLLQGVSLGGACDQPASP